MKDKQQSVDTFAMFAKNYNQYKKNTSSFQQKVEYIKSLYEVKITMHILYHTVVSFNPFPNKPWFLRICSTRLLKTLWKKVKLLVTSNFSFSHSVFYPFGELSAIFIKFEVVVCKLFRSRRV